MNMKKLAYMLCIVLALGFTACGDDEDKVPSVKPTSTGTMTDNDGNEYHWVRIGNLDWMAENMIGGKPFYEYTYLYLGYYQYPTVQFAMDEERDAYWENYGNVYTYEQALENCPDGWRLPTDDDWKNLESALGMSDKELDKLGWRKGAGLLMTQTVEQGTGLHMLFGGQMGLGTTGNIYNISNEGVTPMGIGEYGMYWSATVDKTYDMQCVYCRRIMPYLNEVERTSSTTQNRWLSVRYVRDAKP